MFEVTDEVPLFSFNELYCPAVPDACHLFEPRKLLLMATPLSFCQLVFSKLRFYMFLTM